jgi:hypothetical protein
MRAGDFGELCAIQGGTFDSTGKCSVAAGQIWDPYSGTYDSNVGGIVRSMWVPNNNLATYTSPGAPIQSPGNLIDPVAQKVMSYFPEPNSSGGGYLLNWFGSGASHSSNRQFDIRIDHRFTDNDLLNGKFSYQYNPTGSGLDCFKNFTDSCQGGPGWSNAHAFAVNETHTFSPTLLLTTTLGFTRGVWSKVRLQVGAPLEDAL